MTRRIGLPKSANLRSDLAHFLKFLRQRVDPDVLVLGPNARRPARLGKRVTQEELAEAVGVSREWYAQLETAAATRASPGLLGRIADALMVAPEERAMLFQLALPEKWRVDLRDDSIAVLEAFSRLRSLAKGLLAATSIEDVLTRASEQIADWFDGALVVSSTRRRESGLWECQPLVDKEDRNDAVKVIQDVKDLLPTPELHAALHLYPQLPNAGDVGTPDLWPLPLQRELVKAYARSGVAGDPGVYGRVQSRTGFIGGVYISHEFGHSYSTVDHAVIGAFAELTSYALS
jgi:transcriptional regulator with XRE-family HTH domain